MQIQAENLTNIQRARRLRRELLVAISQAHEAMVYGLAEADGYGFDTNGVLDEAERDIAQLTQRLAWAKNDLQQYRTKETDGDANKDVKG